MADGRYSWWFRRCADPPVVLDGLEHRMAPVPAVGAHTEQILRHLGRGTDDIERLKTNHVV